MNNPFFSIVIPTYNRAKFIDKTIDSVLKQNFQNYECIIVDDGSTDNTQNVVEKYCQEDSRIRYLYQVNSERCIARNLGIKYSRGKYVCFLDSDDFYLENHLEVIYDFLSRKNYPKALVYTNAYNLENGILIDRTCPNLEGNVQSYVLNYTFNPARVAVHKEILTNDFLFDPRIPGLEDLELWLRISIFYPVLQINQRTVVYNLHDETYTLGDSNRYEKELKYFKYIFQKKKIKNKLKLKDKNRLLSMCYFHISMNCFNQKEKSKAVMNALKSFILYPKGYNGKTNKILFYNILKSLILNENKI